MLKKHKIMTNWQIAKQQEDFKDVEALKKDKSNPTAFPPFSIKAAYSFYNIATSVGWEQLMSDALVLAKKLDFDVFNALDLMENKKFLEALKFGIGDGNLQYYIYNWRCPTLTEKDVGLVLQ